MFGILKPCRHTLGPELHRQWMAHLCGCCLGLRDAAGQASRATTNVDAVALSVLVEAQRRAPTETRRAGPCPLRGGRTATVVAASDAASGHATAVSLTMASIGLADRVADRDGLAYRIPVAPTSLAGRWGAAGERVAAGTGLDVAAIRRWTDEATRREALPGRSYDFYLEPTEEAAAIVCAHTATLAGRPGNATALADLGRAFGRIVHLLDAVEDADDDIAAGRCNPLVAQEPTDTVARHRLAVTLLADARRRATDAFDALHLEHPVLARALFVDELHRACRRTLNPSSGSCAHRGPRAHDHDHDDVVVPLGGVVDGRAALGRSSGVRELAGVTAAGAVLLGAGAQIFRPGGQDAMPAQPQDPNQKQRWYDGCCDGCDCCECCCCCGDSSDCCCDCGCGDCCSCDC